MAKSSLKLKGGSARNLELDVVRSLYFLNQLSDKGINAKAFILVYNDEICRRIKNEWIPKYNFEHEDQVEILIFEHFNKATLSKIKDEKYRNSTFTDSKADTAMTITEEYLTKEIDARYPVEKYNNVKEKHKQYINGINWDYFKIFEKK
jgi:uncharacterized membrane-anchored protein